MLKPLQIEGARALADAGAIEHAKVVASGQGLYVEINSIFTVANRTKETRFFAKADTCFSWLREMGISRINEVDLTHWGREEKQALPGLSGVLAFWKLSVAAAIGEQWQRLNQRVESLSQKGKHAEALEVAEKALQAAEDSLEPDHPDIAVLLNSLAIQHYSLGRFEQAEPLYKRALENAEKVLGKNDPFVGICLNNLAEAYDAQGKSEQTEAMYLRALNIFEKKNDADKSDEATILTNLASLYLRRGLYTKAEPLYSRALKIWNDCSGLLGKNHPNEARSLEGLAELYRKTGRGKMAAPLEKQVAAIMKKKNHFGT